MQLARVLEVLSISSLQRTLRARELRHDGTPGDAKFIACDSVGASTGDMVLLEREADGTWRAIEIVAAIEVAAREPTEHGADLGRIV